MNAERCAICFEHRPFISLPCSCQVNYCTSCWDRALATSIAVRGCAQCPTCRSNFCADFNPETGGIDFSLDATGTASRAWRPRLYGKIKPLQIQMLRDYGASMAGNGKGRSGNTLAALAAGVSGEAGTPDRRTRQLPLCICGGELERVSSRVRILRMMEASEPSWRSEVPRTSDQEAIVKRLLASKLVPCDLCEGDATCTGHVWACKNGPRTMLHPAAFNVCEACFGLHVSPQVAKACARNQRRLDRRGRSCGSSAGRAPPARSPGTLPAINRASSLSARVRRCVESALAALPPLAQHAQSAGSE